MSDIAVAVWTNTSGVKVRSRLSDLYSMASDILSMTSDLSSRITSTGVGLNSAALSDIGSQIDARLDVAYTDATALNANGIKERLRVLGWIMRNKLVVTDASGDAILYKDDGVTRLPA
jgi:hypothetical protein